MRIRRGPALALVMVLALSFLVISGCGLFSPSIKSRLKAMKQDYNVEQGRYAAQYLLFNKRSHRMAKRWEHFHFSLTLEQKRLYQRLIRQNDQTALEAFLDKLSIGQREILRRWAEEASEARDQFKALKERDKALTGRYEEMNTLLEEHIRGARKSGDRPEVEAKFLDPQRYAQQQRHHQLETMDRLGLWHRLGRFLDILQ